MSTLQNEEDQYYFKNSKYTKSTINSTEEVINSLNFNTCPPIIIDHDVQDGEKEWPWGYIAQLSDAEQIQQIQNQPFILSEKPHLIIQKNTQKTSEISYSQQKQINFNHAQNQERTAIKVEKKIPKRWIKKMDKILKGKEIKYEDHNRNMPPFFVRIFSKYLDQYKDQFKQREDDLAIIHERLKKIQTKKKANLQDLVILLGDQNSFINRKIMQKIIRKKSKSEIILSRNIENKISYLLCSKIYSLRNKSRYLIGRVQSK